MHFSKKLQKASGPEKDNERTEATSIESIITAGIERGLDMQSIKSMTLGQVVDFCIEYNKRQERVNQMQKGNKKGKRKATQSDWDRFLG